MTSAGVGGGTILLEATGLLGLIVFVYLFGFSLEHSPIVDEVFHLLAARSWATDGTLAVADGEYTRAAGYTVAIGVLFSIFGEDLVLARAISVLTGALWVVAVFVWVKMINSPSA